MSDISITRLADGHLLETELHLLGNRETVFEFFASAENLQSITPPYLRFQVITPPPIVMQAGAMIDYRLRLHGIPLGWRTEITEWNPPFRFVDQQLRGPYRLWVHEHDFEQTDWGTMVRDRVHYAAPCHWLTQRLFVGRDLRNIFKYRADALRKRFGAVTNRGNA